MRLCLENTNERCVCGRLNSSICFGYNEMCAARCGMKEGDSYEYRCIERQPA